MDTRMVSGGEQWNPQLRLMYRTGQGFFGILDPDTLLLRTANLIADYLGTRRVGIALVNNGRLEMVASTLGAIEEIQAYIPCVLALDERSLCGWVALRNQPLLAADVTAHPSYRAVPGFHDTVAELVLPIPSADGSVQGVIDIQSTSREGFTDTACQALEALALQLGLMLDNSALNKVMQRRARDTYTLERIRRQVDQHLSLDPLLAAVVEAVASFTPFAPLAIYLADHRQRFVLRAAPPEAQAPPIHPFPAELFGRLAGGTP
ncbi:MAG TPA: GAF domain-containing protein, partial [Herpetosiphonaceae bacterium]